MPPFKTMPNLKFVSIEANNIQELNLEFSSQNYTKMIKIDLRNNKKLTLDIDDLNKLGKKLSLFQKLRFFNMEHRNLDIKSPQNIETYFKLIKRLPYSMEMFNN